VCQVLFIVLYMKCLCCRDYANDQTNGRKKHYWSFTTLGPKTVASVDVASGQAKLIRIFLRRRWSDVDVALNYWMVFLLPNVL